MKKKTVSGKSQSGVVLVVSLIMLMLLTLIGINAMQSSGLEEKMAGNMRDRSLAFQAAESALKMGEAATGTKPTITCPGAPVGYYIPKDSNCDGTISTAEAATGVEVWNTINWGGTNSIEYPGAVNVLGTLSAKPRYIIEQLSSGSGSGPIELGTPDESGSGGTYRITARGTGGTANAVVILQSVYSP
jgi:type IV pilus assembly protein PilX